MMCGDNEINAAIELVGKTRDDALRNELISYLEEKHKDTGNCSYIYQLYLASKKYSEGK